jgi:hypothetical protein
MNLFGSRAGVAGLAAAFVLLALFSAPALAGWGPATPNFNLQAQLRPVAGTADGFGLVKFRQPKDGDTIVYLDVWVRDLAPSRSYFVQRAVDTNVDGDCTGTNWSMPTLGEVTTDDTGTGRASLTRPLSATLLGVELDIHFRVIDAVTSAVVLKSACYQFTVSL